MQDQVMEIFCHYHKGILDTSKFPFISFSD